MTAHIGDRGRGADWSAIGAELDAVGMAAIGELLGPEQCAELIDLYGTGSFRSTIDMGAKRFGEGEYRYFALPLPGVVEGLRRALWPHLLAIAREWAERRQQPATWPDDIDEWIAMCHAAGQRRPTPLLLRYGPGDWNALHQDLYGALFFPLQVVIGLNEPGVDYTGGELVIVEQRYRAQSRPTATTIPRGHAVVVSTRERPVRSARGWAGAPVRHGVSVVRSGSRHTLGIIFHDAE